MFDKVLKPLLVNRTEKFPRCLNGKDKIYTICLFFLIDFGECPLSSQMASCTPKCLQDSECSTMGGICCPNLCNTKSCARPKAGSQGSSGGGYKGSSGIFS